MAFRRAKRGFRRRLRRRWETDRVIQCRQTYEMYEQMTCLVPKTDAFPLLTMTIPFQAAPERYPSTMTTRRMIFGGMKFQSVWILDPAETTTDVDCDPNPNNLAMVISIWEAIVVLPLLEGSTFAPAYVPILTSPAVQGTDLADRVLWKRLTHIPFWGLGVSGGFFPQLEFTNRNVEDGQQVVKVRAAVDDRHGIFMVRNFVHDVFGLTPSPLCKIPMKNDLWGNLYYRAS